jgi:Zn-dependent protease
VIIPLSTGPHDWIGISAVAQQLQTTLLVADDSRYHPFQLGGKLALDLAIAILFAILSIVGHELSHAAVARSVGSKVFGIVIGMGPTLWRGTIRGVEVDWRKLPIGGYIRHQRCATDDSRWRPILIAGAGPGFNLLTGAAMIGVYGATSTLAIIGVGLGFVNLIPYSVLLPEVNVRVGTDGYQILRHIRSRRSAGTRDHSLQADH